MLQTWKKFWNTIRYGDKKLAAYTILIIILFVLAAILFASAYTQSSIAHAILGIIMIGIDLYLISRLVDEDMDEEEKETNKKKKKEEFVSEENQASLEEEHIPSWADGVQHKTPSFKLGDAEDFETEPEEEPDIEQEESKKPKKGWNLFAFPKGTEKKEKKKPAKAPKKKKPKGFKKVKVIFPSENGSKEQVTMFLKSYKVKQNHITVLIDNSKKYHIKQCPGYLWKDKKGIHILLLEETTREIVLPAASVTSMIYKHAVKGNSREEYLELREPSLKSAIFSAYIPTYYDTGGGGGVFSGLTQAKNLYQIAPDIQFSDKCAKEVMDLLNLNFVVYDKYIKSDQFSEYFKEGHRYQVLLRDKVMEPEEYKLKIQTLLKRMTVANIHQDVFDDTIRQMVMYNIIGSDNGEYYRMQRERIIKEREDNEKKGKRKK